MGIQGQIALVVDDDAGLRAVVARILETAGMHVFHAENTSAAFDLISARRPHVILTDLHLDDAESGFDFLGKITGNSALCDIPMLVLSGRGDQAALQKAFALGARDYLVKPVDAGLLLQKVRRHLRSADFLEWNVTGNITATLNFPCTITAASREGAVIESSIRLAPNQPLRFSGGIFQSIGFDLPFPVRSGESRPCEQNGFRSELRFCGLTREQLAALEEVISRWHTS